MKKHLLFLLLFVSTNIFAQPGYPCNLFFSTPTGASTVLPYGITGQLFISRGNGQTPSFGSSDWLLDTVKTPANGIKVMLKGSNAILDLSGTLAGVNGWNIADRSFQYIISVNRGFGALAIGDSSGNLVALSPNGLNFSAYNNHYIWNGVTWNGIPANAVGNLHNDGLGNLSWITGSSGTVTSIATGYGLTGGTITSSGTLKVDTTSGTGSTKLSTQYNVLHQLDIFSGTTNITTLGIVSSGTWNGSLIGSTYGGTGVNNSTRTITINTNPANFTFSGTYTCTIPATGTVVEGTGSQYGLGVWSGANTITNIATGTAGQELYSNGASNPSFKSVNFYSVTTPTVVATTTTTATMMGLDATITPSLSGHIDITICGNMQGSTAADGYEMQIRYGTGIAPINGATVTGTAAGSLLESNKIASASTSAPFSTSFIVSGLSVGTAYWVDLSYATITAGTATPSQITVRIKEF